VVTPNTVVGENLRRLRRELGLTQEEIGFRAEMHRTQMTLYETGRYLPRTLTIVRLAGSLEATPNDLLEGLSWTPGSFDHGRFLVGGR
jgi:transcriptional regulator with XRE-family HTH domain